MNSIVAASLFENPLVLAAIVLFGALSNWLMKRRGQKDADASSTRSVPPTMPGEPGRSTGQLTLQDALRQLLRGEPPTPAPSLPPIPHASHEGQISRAGRNEEQFYTEREKLLLDELPESDEGIRPNGSQVGERSRPAAAPVSARATRVEIHEQRENPDCTAINFNGQAKHPVRAMRTSHARRSIGRPGSLPPWREPQAARRAFVASLVFAPPKGLET